MKVTRLGVALPGASSAGKLSGDISILSVTVPSVDISTADVKTPSIDLLSTEIDVDVPSVQVPSADVDLELPSADIEKSGGIVINIPDGGAGFSLPSVSADTSLDVRRSQSYSSIIQ